MAWGLLLGLLACGNEDVAGTLISDAPESGIQASGASSEAETDTTDAAADNSESEAIAIDVPADGTDAGPAATDTPADQSDAEPTATDAQTDDGDAEPAATDALADDSESEPPADSPLCDGTSTWLIYTQLTYLSLPVLELTEDLPELAELLFVDEQCNFWVRNSAAGEAVRTGVLDAEQAEQLWSDLGADAWTELEGEHGTFNGGMHSRIRERTDELECWGDCATPEVDAAVEAVFALASDWVERLYPRGTEFDLGVIVVGVPVADLPYAVVKWPLDTPLDEFFDSAPASTWDVGVRVEGDDAELLRQMQEQASDLNPLLDDVLIVEDAAGNRYVILIRQAPPALP